MNFSEILMGLFGWMPAWFSALTFFFLAIILTLFIMKVVAFVLDMLPFV